MSVLIIGLTDSGCTILAESYILLSESKIIYLPMLNHPALSYTY